MGTSTEENCYLQIKLRCGERINYFWLCSSEFSIPLCFCPLTWFIYWLKPKFNKPDGTSDSLHGTQIGSLEIYHHQVQRKGQSKNPAPFRFTSALQPQSSLPIVLPPEVRRKREQLSSALTGNESCLYSHPCSF